MEATKSITTCYTNANSNNVSSTGTTGKTQQSSNHSSVNGWECEKCTYFHTAPTGSRCAMCNELRVSKTRMNDFIQGKPIPEHLKPSPLFLNGPSRTNINTDTNSNCVSHKVPKAKVSVPSKVKGTATVRRSTKVSNPYKSTRVKSSSTILSQNPSENNTMKKASMMQQKIFFGTKTTNVDEKSQQQLYISESSHSNDQIRSIYDGKFTSSKVCNESGIVIDETMQEFAENFLVPAPVVDSNAVYQNVPKNDSVPPENSSYLTDIFQQKNSCHSSIPECGVKANEEQYGEVFNNIDNDTLLQFLESNQSFPEHERNQPKELENINTALMKSRESKKPRKKKSDQTTLDTSSITNKALKPKSKRKSSIPHPILPYEPGPIEINPQFQNTWIYPIDDEKYPQREYQVDITESAIIHNTIVSLPTGLGKTLIAAVVLYNFYRWFDKGKIIFMAPTLPLVYQQVKACYNIMGIPQKDTHILTGKMNPEKRTEIWNSKRVFFCTPQTVQKDLEVLRFDASKVVCIVLDEAHKATGDYSYIKIIQLLEAAGARFRILGLSATPGSNIKAIQAVVDALRINRIEFREESDPDVKKYIHQREVEIIVVKQSIAVSDIQKDLEDIIFPIYDRLKSAGSIGTCMENVSFYSLLCAKDDYTKRNHDKSLLGHFAAAMSLFHLRTLLLKNGIGVLRSNILQLMNNRPKGILSKISKSDELKSLLHKIDQALLDPTSKKQDKKMNNPKLQELVNILHKHYDEVQDVSSRAIVFSQFRESVAEIVSVLKEYQPKIKPRHFIGQNKGKTSKNDKSKMSSKDTENIDPDDISIYNKENAFPNLGGMNQNEQQRIIQEFQDGIYNVLVCTCIGEEGLDIGEVDLIINFDVLRSPIRTLQRSGRTGRKRAGKVIFLVAAGQEERT